MSRRWAWGVGVAAGFVVVTALASVVLAALLVVAVALVLIVRRIGWPAPARWAAVVVAANAVLVPAGLLLHGSAQREALKVPAPAQLVPMTAGSELDPAVARAADPADWRSWMAAASVEDTTGGGTPGTLDLERAFLLSQGAAQPSLSLSFSYLERAAGGGDGSGMLADDEIAAYLTALVGGTAPPDPRHAQP